MNYKAYVAAHWSHDNPLISSAIKLLDLHPPEASSQLVLTMGGKKSSAVYWFPKFPIVSKQHTEFSRPGIQSQKIVKLKAQTWKMKCFTLTTSNTTVK